MISRYNTRLTAGGWSVFGWIAGGAALVVLSVFVNVALKNWFGADSLARYVFGLPFALAPLVWFCPWLLLLIPGVRRRWRSDFR